MDDQVLDHLLVRLKATAGNRAIEAFLRAAKNAHKVRRGELLTTGNSEQLLQHVREAVTKQFATVRGVAALVDRLEENGRQHVFLLDLTPAGARALRASALRAAFGTEPPEPTSALYRDIPEGALFFASRPDALVVKQIHAAQFWEKNEDESFEDQTERREVYRPHYRRAVNLLKVLPERQQAEIRVDRAATERDGDLQRQLKAFLGALQPVVDVDEHLKITPIWNGFDRIARARDETYMSTDEVVAASARLVASNLRAGLMGRDIRDHEGYVLDKGEFVRRHLSVHWRVGELLTVDPERGDPETVYTHLSSFKLDGREYSRVYLSATVSPEVVSGVTGRIRHYARGSS